MKLILPAMAVTLGIGLLGCMGTGSEPMMAAGTADPAIAEESVKKGSPVLVEFLSSFLHLRAVPVVRRPIRCSPLCRAIMAWAMHA